MTKPHQWLTLNRLGKRMAPLLSKGLNRKPFDNYINLLVLYLTFIQGKGSGAGWNLQAEVKAAIAHIEGEGSVFPVLFDVGANTGEWTNMMLNVLGNNCVIHQFEPTIECCEILRENAHPNVKLVEAAVGDANGNATIFSVAGVAASCASLYPRRDSFCYDDHVMFREEAVKVITIDDYLEQNNIAIVDFMKMDIEGHEFAALKGAAKAIQKKRIKAFTFEFGSSNVNSRTFFHDYWDLLHPAGYEIRRICPGGVLLPVEQYYEDLEYFRGATNYLVTLDDESLRH